MKVISYLPLFLSLILICPQAMSETNKQKECFPANPSSVKTAGPDLSPELQKQYVASMKRAALFSHAMAAIFGVASIGCLVKVLCAPISVSQSITGCVCLATGALSYFLYRVGLLQRLTAYANEVTATDECNTSCSVTNVSDASEDAGCNQLVDGVYIFCSEGCPPCKLLHKDIDSIKEGIGSAVSVFEYLLGDPEAHELIKRMGITVKSVPMTVVIKAGKVARIILGYAKYKQLVDDINAVLNG